MKRMVKKMLFICYPKCSTCKKAKKWLDEHGMLVKRPLVVGKNHVLTGFKEAEWTEKLL